MKKLFFIVCMALTFLSCTKENEQAKTSINYAKACWVTPNGNVIPYSEHTNWKEYEKQHFENEKDIDKPKYASRACVFEGNSCSLECVKSTYSNCTSGACAPCGNCNCY